MARHGAADALIAAELDQMNTRRIGATANRSVVGIMTEFSFLADVHRTRNHPDLDDLATTPCSPLYRSHASPDRAFTALLHNRVLTADGHLVNPARAGGGPTETPDG
jgi:hypothetical protein